MLEFLALDDPTVDAPDLVPDDPSLLDAKRRVTAEVEQRLGAGTTAVWLHRLEAAGVPCGPVHLQASALADPQARANGLVATVVQPGIGDVDTVGLLHRIGEEAATTPVSGAPTLGQDTESILGALR